MTDQHSLTSEQISTGAGQGADATTAATEPVRRPGSLPSNPSCLVCGRPREEHDGPNKHMCPPAELRPSKPVILNDMSRFVIVELPVPATHEQRKQIAERIASVLLTGEAADEIERLQQRVAELERPTRDPSPEWVRKARAEGRAELLALLLGEGAENFCKRIRYELPHCRYRRLRPVHVVTEHGMPTIVPCIIGTELDRFVDDALSVTKAAAPVPYPQTHAFEQSTVLTNLDVCADCGCPRAAHEKEPTLVPGCHRSHPHEDMSAECERLTVVARENNRIANETSCSRCHEERQTGNTGCHYCGREWLSETTSHE